MSRSPSLPGSEGSGRFFLLCILALFLAGGVTSARAMDDDVVSVVASRLQHRLDPASYVELYLTSRFDDGFGQQERETVEVRYDREYGATDFMAAYNVQFDRKGQPGREHRLWQQLRHQFTLDGGSSIDSSVRLEERYSTTSDRAGSRVRVQNRWSRNFAGSNLVRLGHEWIMNLNDFSNSTQGGASQKRLIAIVQHNHAIAGGRLELQYQLSYLRTQPEARLQHQFQLLYFYDL